MVDPLEPQNTPTNGLFACSPSRNVTLASAVAHVASLVGK